MRGISQRKAVAWSAVERFAAQGIQFLLGIIIARLLEPSCYGVVAMLYIFLAIGQSLIDSGFASALIQKQDCNDKDYSTVFFFNIFISIILYLMAYIGSPLIAKFYNEPTLLIVTKISTLVFVINAFSIVQRALLIKKMDFKSQTVATIISVFTSGCVGIALAYFNYGIWALVVQSLLNAFINTIILWRYSSWKPIMCFSIESFKSLFSFGARMMFTGLMTTIYLNLYTLVIGKFYNPRELGYYNRMQQIAIFPSKNLTSIIARAVYPKQCEMQNDNEALLKTYIDLLSHSSFVVFPLMFTLAALANPLILVLLGSKWEMASSFLTILCFAYCLDHIQYFNWQILSVKGRSDLSLKSEILKKCISVIILLISIHMGIKAMLWGLVLYALMDVIIIVPFVHMVLPSINYLIEIKAVFKPFILSILLFLLITVSIDIFSSYYMQLFLGGALGVVVYLGFSQILHLKSWIYFRNLFLNLIKS